MKKSWLCAAALLALSLGVASSPAFATTVAAPTFDSLVAQSDYVVRATVKSVNAVWRVDGANRSIITKVELTILESIKGSPPSPLVLEMLGGTIGDISMVVDGTPSFKVGDDDILFIHGNGRQFSPLVGLMYGQYRVVRDARSGEDIVLRSNGSPLYDTADVASPMTPHAAEGGAQPITAAAFAARIRASAAQPSDPAPAHAN